VLAKEGDFRDAGRGATNCSRAIANQPRDAGTNISERGAQVMRQGIDETKISRIDGAKIAILQSRWFPDVVE
jgi:hypothetical protein